MTDRYERIRSALAMGPTPGPWEVANGTDVFTQLGARNAAGVEAAANDGWHIADCDMGPSSTEEGKADIPYVEKRANAAHIAACDPDTIRALLAERDQLAAALEAAREDAERYRWLRDPCSGAERVIFYCRGDYGKGLMSGAMLDAAIDDAMGKVLEVEAL